MTDINEKHNQLVKVTPSIFNYQGVMEVKRLPYSKTTQALFDLKQEMFDGMNKAFERQFSGAIAPTQNQLMLHERQVKENLRGITAQIVKCLAVEPQGIIYIAEQD